VLKGLFVFGCLDAMSLICETVTAANMRDLRRRRDASVADMVELRLDGVVDVDVAGALQGRTRPVLVTCRAPWEGGQFDGSEDTRLRILADAIRGGAEFVDVEWRASRKTLPSPDVTRIVVSHHDFFGVPGDVEARMQSMRAESAAGLVKISCSVQSVRDLVKLRAVASRDTGEHVVIGMGFPGVLSRVCPAAFGSAWTYCGTAAPGQTSFEDLSKIYRVREQTPRTRVFGLTGKPLAHSASPAMHNAAFSALGIDAVYVPIETDDAADLLEVADTFGIDGVSVTAPLKRSWGPLGVEIDVRGSDIGAVNTLRRHEGRWTATNFDADGFLAPLSGRGIELKACRAVVIGAGGAARAAVWALTRQRARVEISARRHAEAAALAKSLGVAVGSWPPAPDWDLLVNATPVGTWPEIDAAPIPRAALSGKVVYDLVYHPRRTQLLTWAQEAGAATIEGLDMLVAQAALQFEHWTGQPAPRDVMRDAAERFLEKAYGDETDNV
jgi:3-dehydroquinate dehydratase / shikimate dehydrogenase